MTHQEEYDKIINFRKSNPLPVSQYGEKHHIVPKSICPILKDSPDNIVRLSAQEHFLAHYHLWKAYKDELYEKKWSQKMCYALHRMKQQLLKCNNVEAMAKLYEEVRIEFAKPRSFATRKKISESLKGKNNPRYGKQHSAETKQKMSIALKGRQFSIESLKKMSIAHKGQGKNTHWYNNGLRNIRAKVCPVGFVKGRVKGI